MSIPKTKGLVMGTVRSNVGLLKLLKLLASCEYLIVIYLSILRNLFILLWLFPSCCMVVRHAH